MARFRGEYLPADSINFDIFARQCRKLSPQKFGQKKLPSGHEGEGGGGRGGFRTRCTAPEKLEEAKRWERKGRMEKGVRRGFETFARNRKDIRAATVV